MIESLEASLVPSKRRLNTKTVSKPKKGEELRKVANAGVVTNKTKSVWLLNIHFWGEYV